MSRQYWAGDVMGKPEWTFWPTQYLHWLNNNGKGVGHGSQVFQVTEAAGSNPEAEISQADAENGKAMGHWHPGAERCGGRRPALRAFQSRWRAASTQAHSVSLKPRLLRSAKCITFQQNGERFPCDTYNCYDILMDFFYRLYFSEQF